MIEEIKERAVAIITYGNSIVGVAGNASGEVNTTKDAIDHLIKQAYEILDIIQGSTSSQSTRGTEPKVKP